MNQQPDTATFDDTRPNTLPPLHRLSMLQDLVISGLTEDEAEAVCKQRKLSEEEVAFLTAEAFKQHWKEMKAINRETNNIERKVGWDAISKKQRITP